MLLLSIQPPVSLSVCLSVCLFFSHFKKIVGESPGRRRLFLSLFSWGNLKSRHTQLSNPPKGKMREGAVTGGGERERETITTPLFCRPARVRAGRQKRHQRVGRKLVDFGRACWQGITARKKLQHCFGVWTQKKNQKGNNKNFFLTFLFCRLV